MVCVFIYLRLSMHRIFVDILAICFAKCYNTVISNSLLGVEYETATHYRL